MKNNGRASKDGVYQDEAFRTEGINGSTRILSCGILMLCFVEFLAVFADLVREHMVSDADIKKWADSYKRDSTKALAELLSFLVEVRTVVSCLIERMLCLLSIVLYVVLTLIFGFERMRLNTPYDCNVQVGVCMNVRYLQTNSQMSNPQCCCVR